LEEERGEEEREKEREKEEEREGEEKWNLRKREEGRGDIRKNEL
jgi:hypothetical protein